MRLNRNQFEVGIRGKAENGDYMGVITGEGFSPVPFSAMTGLLSGLESILNARNYPQSATNERTFNKKLKECGESAARGEMTMEQNGKDNKTTFVVTVLYRQNATWQGTVKWVEGKQEQKFRSALELIKLMDNAVEQTEE